MARNLKTGWVIIATSGATVDGRKIEKEWLEDMAKHYNPELYKAKLWPDHYRYVSGGNVLALKVEPCVPPELEGEINLFAILEPNDWLIEANRIGQYTHPSIEVREDFMGKGFFYLGGLGVTDSPASVGTQELKFNCADGSGKVHVFSGPEINVYASADTKPTSPKGLFQRLFGTAHHHDDPEDTVMALSPEQMAQLRTDLGGDIKTMFADLKKELQSAPAPSTTPAADPAPQGDDLAKQFSALQEENKQLKAGIDKLTAEFAALKTDPAPGTKVPEGAAGEDADCI